MGIRSSDSRDDIPSMALPATERPEHAATEQHYRSLVENLPLVIYTRTLEPSSADSHALFMSGRIKAMLEIEPHEAQPGRVREMIHPDDFARVAPLYDEANRLGLPLSVDYRLVTPSGRTIWVHDESEIVRDEDGNPLHAQGYLLDVTAQRAAELETEEALARERAARIESEQARAAIVSTVERISEAFISFDQELRVRYVNAKAEQLLGADIEALRGSTPHDLYGDRVSPAFESALRRAAAGESVELAEHTTAAFDGIYELRAHPSHDGVWVFLRDVTERRRLEDSLRHAQKLEAVGQLAGGVAHDFNNLLTAISGYADFALRDLDAGHDDRVRHELAGIEEASKRAAELTQQLLAFGRRQVLHRRVVDLNEVVGGAERLLGRLIGEHISIVAATDESLPDVVADSSQLEQVIVNLVVNARDAMANGGRVRTGTSPVELDGAAAARLDVASGPYAALSVSDTGTGIPVQIRDQIFEPFFTTKPVGA